MSDRRVEVFEKNDKFVLQNNKLNAGINFFIQNDKRLD